MASAAWMPPGPPRSPPFRFFSPPLPLHPPPLPFPPPSTAMPDYPNISAANSYLFTRYDSTILDAKPANAPTLLRPIEDDGDVAELPANGPTSPTPPGGGGGGVGTGGASGTGDARGWHCGGGTRTAPEGGAVIPAAPPSRPRHRVGTGWRVAKRFFPPSPLPRMSSSPRAEPGSTRPLPVGSRPQAVTGAGRPPWWP